MSSKYDWRAQKTPEQINGERLDSLQFETREAAKVAQEERTEQKILSACVPAPQSNLSRFAAQLTVDVMQADWSAGRMPKLAPSEASFWLRQVGYHNLEIADGLRQCLRRMAGAIDRHDLPAQRQEAFEQHAMGFDGQ